MATEIAPAIEAIWQRSRGEIDRRITTLEDAVARMSEGGLAEELRAQAERDAHKLAGSLAMFGFPTGSRRAREVEQALGSGASAAAARLLIAEAVAVVREEFDRRSLPANGAEEVTAAGGHSSGVARKIVVIDDSALIRGVVQLGLEGESGWRVRVAASGAEGLELATRERPDAILLDVDLPGMDGPATLTRLRAHESAREIPVLFLSGHGTPQDHAGLQALGAAGVIAKPFDPATLAEEIGRMLSWAR